MILLVLMILLLVVQWEGEDSPPLPRNCVSFINVLVWPLKSVAVTVVRGGIAREMATPATGKRDSGWPG